MLRAARNMADELHVGVCSDALAALHGKRPVMSESERLEVVAALRCVTHAETYDDPSHVELLARARVNVMVIGEEFGSQGVAGHAVCLAECERLGVRVVRLPRTRGVSSSEVKRRIVCLP